jgi:hyperosmotically inducible protein
MACLLASALLVACTRPSDSPAPSPADGAGRRVGDDVKGVARATEKAAKDVGHATAELAEKAGKSLEGATNKAGAGGQDAWITTKVKSQLASEGFDPLHVHVDTNDKVVTLSGQVDSATKAQQAASVARAIQGVAAVSNHLFVKP